MPALACSHDTRRQILLRCRQQDRPAGTQIGQHLGGDREGAGLRLDGREQNVSRGQHIGQLLAGWIGSSFMTLVLGQLAIAARHSPAPRPPPRRQPCKHDILRQFHSSDGLCLRPSVPE